VLGERHATVADRPAAATARLTVLHNGYIGPHTASTVVYVADEGRHIVVDPGMVPAQAAILDPLRAAGCEPGDVTDVVLSHHHPDHTMNAGLFPNARVHDFWAVYHHDAWEDRRADGVPLTPAVRLLETPGHSPQDITTVVATPGGIYACTHVWWADGGPQVDPRASDQRQLDASRQRVLAVAGIIVPGHGAPYRP
jgi:glyoxylase-like metal-dependent hydrolase (beta-lactamase superfamily II)